MTLEQSAENRDNLIILFKYVVHFLFTATFNELVAPDLLNCSKRVDAADGSRREICTYIVQNNIGQPDFIIFDMK